MKWYYWLLLPFSLILLCFGLAVSAKKSDEVMYPHGWWV